MYAPIVIFCYRRSINPLLSSLERNSLFDESPVYIFSDGWKSDYDRVDVLKVRSELDSLKNNERFWISKAEQNFGLATSVISGVSFVIKKHGSVIVLEDDLEVSQSFLEYMNNALSFYKDDQRIWSISGYSPPVFEPNTVHYDTFLFPRGSSWGWATWEDRWNSVDWDVSDFQRLKKDKNMIARFNRGGDDLFKMLELQMLEKIDSWAIRWCFTQFLNGQYTVFPYRTLVNNLGFTDGIGTHNSGNIDHYQPLPDHAPDVTRLATDRGSQEVMKRFHDLSLATRIGYFLKKYGGYRFAKKIYNIVR